MRELGGEEEVGGEERKEPLGLSRTGAGKERSGDDSCRTSIR